MHITVTGRHLDVGASLRRRVEEGLAAAVAKYFDRAIEAHVTFDKRGQFFLADIAVHVGTGIVAHSGGEADDPYVAFSGALEHLAKRLRRHKRRLRDHHNAVSRAEKTEQAWQYVLSGEDEGEEKAEGAAMNGEPLVVAEMEAEIPTLSVGGWAQLGQSLPVLVTGQPHDGRVEERAQLRERGQLALLGRGVAG